MNKLPFVWELNSEGVISHAIGSPYGFEFHPRCAQKLLRYFENKTLVMVEDDEAEGTTIDSAVLDISRCAELPVKPITTKTEQQVIHKMYAPCIKSREAIEAYKREDEVTMKKFYSRIPYSQETEQVMQNSNVNLVERSLRHVKKAPSLVVANLARFLIEPSILRLYEMHGIRVKKTQPQ